MDIQIQIKRIKRFVKKHQKGLLFVGGTIVGVTVTGFIFRSQKGKIIEVIPEWAEKWREHCRAENLLFENGLPIFANAEQTVIYRDAIVEEAIPEFIEMGFEIIDRV